MAAVNDVFAFQLYQRLFGQTVVNTFACRIRTLGVVLTDNEVMDGLCEDEMGVLNAENKLRRAIGNLQTAEVEHLRWHISKVHPDPTQVRAYLLSTNTSGTDDGTCETANIALSVRRKGDGAGRRQVGRIAIAGLSSDSYAAGKITPAFLAFTDNIKEEVCGLHNALAGFSFEMGFWNGEHTVNEGTPDEVHYPAQFVYCTSAEVKDTVRTQRSRTLNVGI